MMSKSHYWVVCDAVDFIKNYGNEEEKLALQNFELAYGRKTDVMSLEPRQSAIEFLVGYEALYTDKYSDLALEFSELKFLGKNSITGLAYHQFTAMNHFVNPYPETLDFWSDVDGYSFNASSRTGFDSIIVEGMSQYLGARVHIENSPVFDRIRDYCSQDYDSWESNFRGLISRTKFAPWTALSKFYYDCLINRHFQPLEVKGPNLSIVGVQLLGPVLHALADACSVQHVRGTLGFGHAIWENYLKSMVYNRKLTIDPLTVRNFLASPPFNPAIRATNDKGMNVLDIPTLVFQLSLRTADRLKASTRQNWDTLWSAGDDFWKKYLNGDSLESDTSYLYHMAIAATVHVIKESSNDLIASSILVRGSGLNKPELMPSTETVNSERGLTGLLRASMGEAQTTVVSEILEDPAILLGFNPLQKSGLARRLKEFNRLFGSTTLEKLDTSRASILLKEIQDDLVDQYKLQRDISGAGFCPITATQSIPMDSDLSAHWGIGTFRPPTLEELENSELFSRYITLDDIHCYKAHKLQLTQLLAGLEFVKASAGISEDDQKAISDLMDRVGRLREFDSYDRAQAFNLEPCREFRRQDQRKESVSRALASAERKSVSLWERIRNFFNIPVAALATAAAVALLLIMIYPRGGMEQIIGLSGETWEPPRPKLMAPQIEVPEKPHVERLKAAIVVVFENFKEKPDQKFVDDAYRYLEPSALDDIKYEFVNPATISQSVKDGSVKAGNLTELRQGLSSTIQVSSLLIVKVRPKDAKFDIEAELLDLKTGASIMKFSRLDVASSEIGEAFEMVSRQAFGL